MNNVEEDKQIHLNVEDYCHNCPEFNPILESKNKSKGATIICINSKRCHYLFNYIMKYATKMTKEQLLEFSE